MEFTAKQIAEFLGGRVEGNPDIKVGDFCKIEQGESGKLSFLANPKYTPYIYDTKASIVIVNESLELEKTTPATLIRVKDAYSSFATLLELVNQYRFNRTGISSLAFINESASVGQDCYIGEYAVIDKGAKIGSNCKIYPQVYVGENVQIGDNVVLYSGVKIYHDVVIGNDCIIHSGAVIGADGFGFAPLEDGSFKKIPQTGNVIIEDNVEIGANTCVDRSTMGATIIYKGAKIDNLCQIAHNVTVGRHTVIAAQTGLAGSVHLGENCFIGGQVGIIGHLKIGNRVKMAAKSGVISNLKDDTQIMGFPEMYARDFMRSYVLFKKLPEMEKRLMELENKLRDNEK